MALILSNKKKEEKKLNKRPKTKQKSFSIFNILCPQQQINQLKKVSIEQSINYTSLLNKSKTKIEKKQKQKQKQQHKSIFD